MALLCRERAVNSAQPVSRSDGNEAPPRVTSPSDSPGSGVRHPERSVALLSTVLVILTGLLYYALPDRSVSVQPSSIWVTIGVGIGFAAADYSVFRFMFRREGLAFSLSEIPLAFSLVWLPLGPAILVRIVGSMAMVLIVRRPPLHKTYLNVSLFAFEMALAFVVFRGLIDFVGDSHTTYILAAIAAAAICSVAAAIIVAIAISRFEGGFWQRLSGESVVAWWLFIVNAALAGMVLGLALISPWLLLIALVPVALLWYIMRAYGAVDQRLRELNAVHGFTGRVGQSLDPVEICRAATVEASVLLRSEGAALVVFEPGSSVQPIVHGDVGVRLPLSPDDPIWTDLLARDQASVLTGEELLAIRTTGSTVREVMISRISDDSGLIGVLAIAGRRGADKRFGPDDRMRLQSLGEQLAASLRRGLLHQRIEREARQDGLTGLPNRVSFERSLADIAIGDHHGDGQLFVVMLDLDRFKEVNDTLGHQAGDQLLVEVGERMQRLLGPGDVLARLAADEFAIVGHRRNHDEMLELAWSCVREVGRPVTLDGLEIVVTASAGLAVVDEHVDADEPLRFADIAMFNAKSQRLGVEVYRDEIDRRTPARLSMLGDLRSAIEEEKLHIHLQPKLDLNTGTVVGAEALVRWTHAVRGMVPPAQFVRVAEDTGLIKQLTDMMLHRGIATLRQIHDRGYLLGLSVNLSTHDLLDRRLAERVQEHLAMNDVDPSMLTLEITESSLLIDAPRARATINELHEVGVSLSIDDFGTGYSSLSYLRRLPVGELKIDQSFVANVLLDEQDEVIVRSTIDLGHNLGLVVVAEGVENNEVLERLRTLGCDVAQGYCISRPLAPGHFLSWLATTGHPSRKIDPLDFSRWIDSGPGSTSRSPDPALD
jgi:diguanylate cyclase (GGDEF)-like protein